MPQPGDEAAGPADADTVRRLVTLCFQRKLDRDRIFPGTQEIVTNGVPAAITPGTGDVDTVDMRLADLPQVGGELLKVIRPVREMPVYSLQQRHVGYGGQLLLAAPDNNGRRS